MNLAWQKLIGWESPPLSNICIRLSSLDLKADLCLCEGLNLGQLTLTGREKEAKGHAPWQSLDLQILLYVYVFKIEFALFVMRKKQFYALALLVFFQGFVSTMLIGKWAVCFLGKCVLGF